MNTAEALIKLLEEDGDGEDNQERGKGSTKSRCNGTTHVLQLIADKDGDVDGEHTRTALGNGYQVEHLLLFHPAVLVDYLFFYQRYHGISTTKGEYANLKEGLE